MKIKACLWTMFAVCVGSLCHVSAQPSVYVKIHSYTNSISAEAIARQIDADILRKSTANE